MSLEPIKFDSDTHKIDRINNAHITQEANVHAQEVDNESILQRKKILQPLASVIKTFKNLAEEEWATMTPWGSYATYKNYTIIFEVFDERWIPFIEANILIRGNATFQKGQTISKNIFYEIENLGLENIYLKKVILHANIHLSTNFSSPEYRPNAPAYQTKILVAFKNPQKDI